MGRQMNSPAHTNNKPGTGQASSYVNLRQQLDDLQLAINRVEYDQAVIDQQLARYGRDRAGQVSDQARELGERRRRTAELLSKSPLGQAILASAHESTVAIDGEQSDDPETARLHEDQRKRLLGLTPLGRELLNQEAKAKRKAVKHG